MKPRRSLFAIFISALLPQPVFAFESGVNAMQAARDFEQQSLTAWVFQELSNLVTGFRNELEPILPRVEKSFDPLDAEIAAFVAEGQAIQTRLQELIEATETKQHEPQPVPDQTMIAELPPADTPVLFYSPKVEQDFVPEIEFFNEHGDLLNVDTSKGIDLPDLTVDPRDGGTYESEIALIQPAFDLIDLVQNQVPAPIQSVGNDLYDKLTGTTPDANRD